jgi:hypothetical protein
VTNKVSMDAPARKDFVGDNREVSLGDSVTRVFRIAWNGERYFWDLPITGPELFCWRHGALIQHAMPQLTSDQAEFIISGTLPGEWEAMFDGGVR